MENKQNKKYITSYVLSDGQLVELIYRPELDDVRLITFKDGQKQLWEEIDLGDKLLLPYPAENELIQKKVVRLPSGIEHYESEVDLVTEIQEFIHKYLDISLIFETISAYYVLLTYLYDKLPNILYLRFIGDYGGGKSRALSVFSSICYKTMTTSGASSVSPIFRIIDAFKGTLILDEGDLSGSDTYNELVKILNSGYERDKPVLRSEQSGNSKAYDVKAFDVYCPKVIATRFNFKDLALESRCLTEVMAKSKIRENIPLNLPDSFEDEALKIRNKLLCFRFKNYHNNFSDYDNSLDASIEPRLRQIANVMLSITKDDCAKAMIKEFMIKYNEQIVNDRSLEFEAKFVEIMFKLSRDKCLESITVNEITEEYNKIRGSAKELTSGGVGKILKNKLNIYTRHTLQGNVIKQENKERLDILYHKYGMMNEMNDMKDNGGDISNEKDGFFNA